MADSLDRISFWLDPGCPWTWLTSRWLETVALERGIDVQWQVMSLAILNEGQDLPTAWRDRVARSWRPVRLLAAADAHGGPAAVGRLYGSLGRLVHEQHHEVDRETAGQALAAAGLPPELIDALDDPRHDAAVRRSHARGQARIGTDAGSPVISLGDGPGFFGPVITAVPTAEESSLLLDALGALSSIAAFSELKRSR